jgi:hypothetical protein
LMATLRISLAAACLVSEEMDYLWKRNLWIAASFHSSSLETFIEFRNSLLVYGGMTSAWDVMGCEYALLCYQRRRRRKWTKFIQVFLKPPRASCEKKGTRTVPVKTGQGLSCVCSCIPLTHGTNPLSSDFVNEVV